MVRETVREIIAEAIREIAPDGEASFGIEAPEDSAHGDYATNAAFQLKGAGKTARDFAAELARKISEHGRDVIASAEPAGPGFMNMRLRDGFLFQMLQDALRAESDWGTHAANKGKTLLVEFTDPNPFKQFHIGHLMSNAIGESISRLYEASGAEVLRLNYQGDVGVHVACSVWGMLHGDQARPDEQASLAEKAAYLGQAYARGRAAYEDAAAKEEIDLINKKLYEQSDPGLNALYGLGRKWSLDYFETIYARLGTKFAGYFFESEAGPIGLEIVRAHPGTFIKSNGAIIFRGAEFGLHNRVFVNSLGLPTYEAKELGLNKMKFERYPDADASLIITANEIDAYFRVVLKAMASVLPEIAAKTKHISHGFLRLPSGKMSSRTGDVITAERLISEVEAMVLKKLEARPELDSKRRTGIARAVAIGAIKYSILKQGIGRDIIFDFENSIAFQGDSAPYLQYTHARLKSILRKAAEDAKAVSEQSPDRPKPLDELEHRLLVAILRLPEAAFDALQGYAPTILATYLLELAQFANEFYHTHPVIQEGDPAKQAFRLAVVRATALTIKNGLWLLGIEAPEEM